jgi:4-hydroxybenzoate polyprenyltransferase
MKELLDKYSKIEIAGYFFIYGILAALLIMFISQYIVSHKTDQIKKNIK